MRTEQWGSRAWQQAHFPAEQLDGDGDTWGMRWRGVEKLRHASYIRLVGTALEQPRPLDVLDIGCALCDFTRKAWALNPANRFWVMDTAENAISWVRQRFPAFHSAVATLPEIPFDVQFDVVFCLEVLCYLGLEDRRETIRRIHARMKPCGLLAFSGVLDGGRRYHSEAEALGMIGESFEVERVTYNDWWLYRNVIEPPLEAGRAAVAALQQELVVPQPRAESRQSSPGGNSRRMATMLRAAQPASGLLLSGASKAFKGLLASRVLAEAAQAVSRPFRASRGATEIVVLARKRQW